MKRNGYDCFQLNRRDFIGAIAGTAAWTGCTSLLAAERLGRPNLIVGVLSDIHLSNEEVRKSKSWTRIFVETLKFYKKRGVDAVIIAGDLTNGGRMSEMRVVADAWKSVFGDSDTPVKVFVTGNHEFVYYDKKKKEGDLTSPVVTDGLYADIRRNWKELFNEEWSPYFIKTVKGYSFVGAHWGDHLNGNALKAFIDSNRNMRSLMVDKLMNCEMVVLTRTPDNIDKDEIHKIIRGISRRAAISYDYPDGHIEYDEIEDPLPFDKEAPVIEIADDDFALWYRDLSEEMDTYEGKTVHVKGLVARDNKLGKNGVVIGRHIMTCCADDIAYSGLVCNFSAPVSLKTRDWITVTAKISLEPHKLYGGRRGPVLYATEYAMSSAPKQEVATFY